MDGMDDAGATCNLESKWKKDSFFLQIHVIVKYEIPLFQVLKQGTCFISWASVKAARMLKPGSSGLYISALGSILIPVIIPRFQAALRQKMQGPTRALWRQGLKKTILGWVNMGKQ